MTTNRWWGYQRSVSRFSNTAADPPFAFGLLAFPCRPVKCPGPSILISLCVRLATVFLFFCRCGIAGRIQGLRGRLPLPAEPAVPRGL